MTLTTGSYQTVDDGLVFFALFNPSALKVCNKVIWFYHLSR